MVKISFVMISARNEYPYLGRPDLHLFEPTLESFKNQTITDFEWIIVDVLYDQRKDYFKDLDLPFKVKHIPAKPNHWLEKGFPGICGQYNKGIIYADGELVFFTGDSYMVIPQFMKNLWTRYMQGYFGLAWYFFDRSYTNEPFSKDREEMEKYAKAYPESSSSPFEYDIAGYTGKNISVEHRYVKAFKGNSCELFQAPWEWWFGCSSASLEALLKINGFNEQFDGDRMLLDCDVGSRLELAGYGVRFALFRDIFLIRAMTDMGNWNKNFHKDKITIKCNYPLIWYNRFFNNYKANVKPLTEQDIRWIKEVWCPKKCPIRELCKREHKWQFPFEHKAGYAGHNSKKVWFNYWQKHQTIVDLTQEREKRLSGDPKYEVGTFT
jgi:glycosyltransferase involved in cell wall biosynthesis